MMAEVWVDEVDDLEVTTFLPILSLLLSLK